VRSDWNSRAYVAMIDAINQTRLLTIMGQHLDMTSANQIERFNLPCYAEIVRLKTSHYSFHLPLKLALLASNIDETAIHDATKQFAYEIGFYFQVQDDYVDCCGDPTVIGKTGTDIQEGKCTWLICTLAESIVEEANQTEKSIILEHYGKPENESVQKIKQLYRKHNIPAKYAKFETEQVQKCSKLSMDFAPRSLGNFLHDFISNHLFQRQK